MTRLFALISAITMLVTPLFAQNSIVVDSTDKNPISAASIFDKSGAIIGMTSLYGALPVISHESYPIIIRCLGYEPQEVATPIDSIYLQTMAYDLPELTFNKDDRDILRLVCYVREYMSATSTTDTVIAFSENMVDYMLPLRKIKKNKVSDAPRILAKKNYARFINDKGRDSIAVNIDDEMLSWISFMRIDTGTVTEPKTIKNRPIAIDSVKGKYGIKTLYRKNRTSFVKSIDGLADQKGHKMSPAFFKLFGFTIDFTEMIFVSTFNTNDAGIYKPNDLISFSFSLQALARGKIWKKAFDAKSPIEIHSYFEIYPVEKEFLTLEEAKELSDNRPAKPQIKVPENVAPLNTATQELIRRGNELKASQKK